MYRTDLPLQHPPYVLAIACVYLALAFLPFDTNRMPIPCKQDDGSGAAFQHNAFHTTLPLTTQSLKRQKIDSSSSKSNTPGASATYASHFSSTSLHCSTTKPDYPRIPTALIQFLAGLNVSLPLVVQIVQEMLKQYDMWRQLEHRRTGLSMLYNHAAVFACLYRMHDERRKTLLFAYQGSETDNVSRPVA